MTLRESLTAEAQTDGALVSSRDMEVLAERLEIRHLLDLPLVALSNGQTRRAKIITHLLKKPAVLILDEPLSMSLPHR